MSYIFLLSKSSDFLLLVVLNCFWNVFLREQFWNVLLREQFLIDTLGSWLKPVSTIENWLKWLLINVITTSWFFIKVFTTSKTFLIFEMFKYQSWIVNNWLQSSLHILRMLRMNRGTCLECLPPLGKSSASLGKGWCIVKGR